MAHYEYSAAEIDAATDAALEALAWTTLTHPEDDDDYRGYLSDSDCEFSDAARATMRDMLESFMSDDRVIRLFGLLAALKSGPLGSTFPDRWTADQIGHDFMLTANGHGAGFWDRDYRPRPKAALDALTEIVRPFGEIDACVSDAGQIEISAHEAGVLK